MVPFSLLLAFFLQGHSEKFGKSNFSKIVSVLIALFILSLFLFSPLVFHYRQPLVAASLTKSVLGQATEAASQLPAQSPLYLLNFPEFLSLEENGFNYPIILVNQASVQAMLDHALPEKEFKVVSLTSSTVLAAELGENQFIFHPGAACDFLIENVNEKAAKINLNQQLQNGEIILPEEECETAFFLFFDGKKVRAIKAGNS